MANSKDNLQKYGKGFIGFDEPSGNALDSIGGWTGTLYNNPMRVAGWNGKGYAMSFNGTNQYIEFNSKIIPVGMKSIRLKLKATSLSSRIIGTTGGDKSGFIIGVSAGKLGVFISDGTGKSYYSNKDINDNKWHDILITWDGTTNTNGLKMYIDDMTIPDATHTTHVSNEVSHYYNCIIGKDTLSNSLHLNGQLDSIEIYDRIISPIPDKYLVSHNSQYKYHNGTAWQTTTATEVNFKQYGMSQLSQITEAQWKELSGNKSLAVWSDFEDKKWSNAVLNVESYTPQQLLGDNPQVAYYTDSGTTDVITETETEPFSVYDYISDTPSALVYTESTEDIIISTATEPFDIYDEFGDSVEILYYTDDETVTNADLILEANWSPIDELDGDLEVVTWTDEVGGVRKLEVSATPKPQFTYSQDLIPLEEFIKSVQVRDLSIYKDDSMIRILMSNNNIDWYTWNGMDFIKIINITDSSIIADGMTVDKFNGLTPQNLTKWSFNAVNIGIFLYDDVRNEVRSKVAKVSVDTQIPSNTSKVEDVNLYILNTTAKINIDLSGLSLTGQVTDDDMTRVQYRVKLNSEPYYPADGSFTALSSSPLNIDLTIKSSEIKIGDWNTIEVEFQDYFGSSDAWSAQFIGKYAGIMFSDPDGNYYSSDVGQVLKYLDFGEILTGQVTEYYEVKLKNEYGFDVRDATLTVNTQNFPRGLKVELSSTNSGVGNEEIAVGSLAIDDEFTFYVRMRSSADTVPNNNSKFDIVVLAIRDI